MALRGILKYKNLDSTADLNYRNAKILQRGIYSGGALILSGSSLSITVPPFTALGYDGMVVTNDVSSAIVIPGHASLTVVSYLVCYAKYSTSGDPTLELKTVTSSQWLGVEHNYYITFAKITVPGGATSILSSYVDYSECDYSEAIGKDTLRPAVATSGDLPVIQNRVGDIRLTLDTSGFYVWNGTAWVQLPYARLDLANLFTETQTFTPVTVNTDGIIVTGNGTGVGGIIIGGAGFGGDGVRAYAGIGSDGYGIKGYGNGINAGGYLRGGGNGPGVEAIAGGGNNAGALVYGIGSGGGIYGEGGDVAGYGGSFVGGTDGTGVIGLGTGIGAGGSFTGGGMDGIGLVSVGQGAGAGGTLTGGATNGVGAICEGKGTGVAGAFTADTGANINLIQRVGDPGAPVNGDVWNNANASIRTRLGATTRIIAETKSTTRKFFYPLTCMRSPDAGYAGLMWVYDQGITAGNYWSCSTTRPGGGAPVHLHADLNRFVPNGCTLTSVRAYVDPGVARAVFSNMALVIKRRAHDTALVAISNIDWDDSTTNAQWLAVTPFLADALLDTSIYLYTVYITSGWDPGIQYSDLCTALEITYTEGDYLAIP